jgi:hypothetical protein
MDPFLRQYVLTYRRVGQLADIQVYALIHVSQIWRSDHSAMRKLALMVESVYNALNLLFTWFALANFYIFFVSSLIVSILAAYAI